MKQHKENICFKHGARHINFSYDRFFQDIVSVSFYLLLFRIFFAFFFAFIFAQQWHVEKVFGWLPIIAFNADASVFITMNSFAVFTAGTAVFAMFLYHVYSKKAFSVYKIWTWFIGVWMVLLQYGVLLYLDPRIHFGVRHDLWIPFIVYALLAVVVLRVIRARLRRYDY